METDRKLKKRAGKLLDNLNKSQGQTCPLFATGRVPIPWALNHRFQIFNFYCTGAPGPPVNGKAHHVWCFLVGVYRNGLPGGYYTAGFRIHGVCSPFLSLIFFVGGTLSSATKVVVAV